MKTKYALILIFSPIILLLLLVLSPFYVLHRLIDERSYNTSNVDVEMEMTC